MIDVDVNERAEGGCAVRDMKVSLFRFTLFKRRDRTTNKQTVDMLTEAQQKKVGGFMK